MKTYVSRKLKMVDNIEWIVYTDYPFIPIYYHLY